MASLHPNSCGSVLPVAPFVTITFSPAFFDSTCDGRANVRNSKQARPDDADHGREGPMIQQRSLQPEGSAFPGFLAIKTI